MPPASAPSDEEQLSPCGGAAGNLDRSHALWERHRPRSMKWERCAPARRTRCRGPGNRSLTCRTRGGSWPRPLEATEASTPWEAGPKGTTPWRGWKRSTLCSTSVRGRSCPPCRAEAALWQQRQQHPTGGYTLPVAEDTTDTTTSSTTPRTSPTWWRSTSAEVAAIPAADLQSANGESPFHACLGQRARRGVFAIGGVTGQGYQPDPSAEAYRYN